MRRPLMVFAGWVLATWQLSLGFTFGVPLAYLIVGVGAVAAVVWFRGGRRPLGRGVIVASIAGAALFAGWAGVQTSQYFRVARDHPEAVRSFKDVQTFSPPPSSLLAATPQNLLWGRATEPFRRGFLEPQEKMLFPGLTVTVLAIYGVARGRTHKWIRLGLAAATVGTMFVAFGSSLGGRFAPYRLMYFHLPGWRGFRTPGRLVTFAILSLALLAATGAARMLPSKRNDRPSRLRRALVVFLMGLIVLEGSGSLAQPSVPSAPPAQLNMAGPQYHLPTLPAHIEALYLFWSTEGFPSIVNGYAAFLPNRQAELRAAMTNFPDPRSVAALQALGVRTVIVHLDLVPRTPWEATASRSVEGLPLRREEAGNLVLYHLETSN